MAQMNHDGVSARNAEASCFSVFDYFGRPILFTVGMPIEFDEEYRLVPYAHGTMVHGRCLELRQTLQSVSSILAHPCQVSIIPRSSRPSTRV